MWSGGGGGKGRFLLVYLYITYIILCMQSKQHNFGLSKSEGFFRFMLAKARAFVSLLINHKVALQKLITPMNVRNLDIFDFVTY